VAGARTIANLWRNSVGAGHPDPAYLEEIDGDWREVPRSEATLAVSELANGLLALGVQKGDAFGILARTTLEWAYFDFALGLVGAVGAPIYASSSERDAQYVLAHSQAVGVLVEDEAQRAKLGDFAGHVFSFVDLPALRDRGREYAAADPGALDARADSIQEDDLFTFIYTSGTTGPPKACMIRHRNYYAMVEKGDEMDDRLIEPHDLCLLYLPLAHNYGRLLHLSTRCASATNCSASGRRSSRACRASTRRSTLQSPPDWPRRPGRGARSPTGRFASDTAFRRSDRRSDRFPRRSPSSTASPTGWSTRR
jgi:long-chain acyl-CoA synthetase